MAALKYWLWLTTAPALSNRAKLLLLEHFSSPEDVYYAQPDQLCLVEGITRQQAESLSDKSLARAEKVLADCARDGQFIVTMDDAAYPARLRDMYDPPVLLYGKGSMPLFDEEAAVAVVGHTEPVVQRRAEHHAAALQHVLRQSGEHAAGGGRLPRRVIAVPHGEHRRFRAGLQLLQHRADVGAVAAQHAAVLHLGVQEPLPVRHHADGPLGTSVAARAAPCAAIPRRQLGLIHSLCHGDTPPDLFLLGVLYHDAAKSTTPPRHCPFFGTPLPV